MRRLLGNAGLVVLSLAVALVLLELGVRLLVPEGLWRFRDSTRDWTLDPEVGWVNRPALDVESSSPTARVRFQTNSDGLIPAGVVRAKKPDVVRIMIFGDSMVVGRDLPQSANYSARLEALLRERGIAAEIINAGVAGYSTDQALLLMQRWVPRYRPDLVIFASTSNDFGGNALRVANYQAKPMFRLDGNGRLVLSPPELVANQIQPYGSGPRSWIQHWALYRLLQPRIIMLRSRLGGWEQRMLLGVMDEVYIEPRAADRVDWPLFSALLTQMREVANQNGAEFLVIAHPEVGEVWDPYIDRMCEARGWPRDHYDRFALERHVAEAAEQASVRFVPLVAEFSAHQDRGPFHLLPRDGHLSAAGHQLLAERLADHLSDQLASMQH